MTLDERVRVGLRRSADTGHLDEDVVFDQIRTAYERGRVRGRVLRQATTVAIVLTLIAGIGVFVSLRAAPVRYRTTVAVAMSTGVPGYAGNPLKIALAPTTQRAALHAARIPLPENRIRFAAISSSKSRLSLAVTSPSIAESTLVTRHWVAVMSRVARQDSVRQILAHQRWLATKVRTLHDELQRVDQKLMKMNPVIYYGILQFDSPSGNLPGGGPRYVPPPVPEKGTVAELNLAFLRLQILAQITRLGNEAGAFRIGPVEANVSVRTVGPTSTTRVSRTSAATGTVLSGWFVALLLVAIGGVIIYRRRSTLPSAAS